MANEWNAEHYDNKLDYVSGLGKGVISLLQPKPGEIILDLGCGTGDLTHEIAMSGASVMGIDQSDNMIQRARKKYPGITFTVGNAEELDMNQQFDAVFSNAALHWMTNPSKVIEHVRDILLPGGRFVAEFGGKGNVQTVIDALEATLNDLGINIQNKNPWYFPGIGEYASLLEKHGFIVTYALRFSRPTLMPDGDKGLKHWLDGFAGSYLQSLGLPDRSNVIQKVTELCRSTLYKNGQWYIDYKRLRIMAEK
jgi:trans-aconitate methyltransferase